MRASALFAALFFCSFASAAEPNPLTAQQVFKTYRTQGAGALADKYRKCVNHTYDALLGNKANSEQQLVPLLKVHDDVFDRLISLAVAESGNPAVAKLSAEWALNGRAIAPQVIAELRQGTTKKEHFVKLEQVREKLPPDSVLIEIVHYNRYPLKEGQDSKSRGKHYAAWFIPPGTGVDIKVVDLGKDGAIDDLVKAFNDQLKAAEAAASPKGGLKRLLQLNVGENDGEVKRWNDSLAAIRQVTLDKIDDASNGKLYDANTKHWVLGPSADLWLVPFSALPLRNVESKEDANKVKYAAEEHKITYVVTGRDILTYGARPRDKPSDALILGRPDFNFKSKKLTTSLASLIDSGPLDLQQDEPAGLSRLRSRGGPLHVAVAELQPSSSRRLACATIIVTCPADAKVFFDGEPTRSTGPVRWYMTPPLPTHADSVYEAKVEVRKDGKLLSAVRKVAIRGGQVARIELVPSAEPHGFLLGLLDNGFEDVQELEDIAKALASKLQTKKLLLGKGASEPAFYFFYRNPPVPGTLIFCTHGFFQKAEKVDPLTMCGLALAGANRRANGTLDKTIPDKQSDDGLLTGLEVSMTTNLKSVDLVVTIACQTSQGDVLHRGNDGVDGGSIASLRHAFRLAGARTVVATLWKIHPESGYVTIVGKDQTIKASFFDNLITGKMLDKGQALHDAQVETIQYLRRTNNGLAHPYFWASFSLTGDWGVLAKAGNAGEK